MISIATYHRLRSGLAMAASLGVLAACGDSGDPVGPTPETEPNAPSDLQAEAESTSQIALSWTSNSDNEGEFRIERQVDGGEWADLESVAAGVITYADTELAASTSYGYRVRACNDVGCSNFADAASATTEAVEGDDPGDPDDPSDPDEGEVADGEMRFDFSGDRSGSFEAEGTLERDNGAPTFGTWATAQQVNGRLAITAFEGVDDPDGNIFQLNLTDVTETGTYDFDSAGCGEESGTCRIGVFAVDISLDENLDEDELRSEVATRIYFVESGEFTISSMGDDRVVGTFSGTATRADRTGPEVEIEDGEFDVPLETTD